MSELSILELETEHVELLPERETLQFFVNVVKISQHASANAVAVGFLNLAAANAQNFAIGI
jgi:hypothetical protein